MNREIAEMTVDSYYRTHDSPVDLDKNQILVVIAELMKVESAGIKDVARIIKREFPMRLSANRYNRTEQPTQSQVEMKKEILEFLKNDWANLTGGAFLPLKDDSEVNFKNFSELLNAETLIGRGTKPVNRTVLADIAVRLFTQRLLERPRIVERVVEVEKKVRLTRREEQKHNFNLEKLMNAPGVEAIKGIGEQVQKKPVVSEAELAAQARHDLNENSVMGDVRSLISGHTRSGNHSSTRYEREILTNLMNAGIRKNLPAETILGNVKNLQSEMSKWSAQEALKRLHPALFTTPKAAGY